MPTFVTVIHICTCLLLILVILIQSGKGAEISASLGGSSQTVFGSSGGANFFTRFTSVMAAVFMATSLILTVLGNQSRKSVFEGVTTRPPISQSQPATGTGPGSGGAQPVAPTRSTGPGGSPATGGAVNTAPQAGGAPAAMPGAPANNAATKH